MGDKKDPSTSRPEPAPPTRENPIRRLEKISESSERPKANPKSGQIHDPKNDRKK